MESQSDQLSSSLEDYLEAIFNISGVSGVARCKDIAGVLDVAKPSVTGAVKVLKKKGLANYEPYGYVTLTEEGKKAAEKVVRKHNILKTFFVNVLGIDIATAQKAACQAEHVLGTEVIERVLYFIEFVTRQGEQGNDLIDSFEKFYDGKRKNTLYPSERVEKVVTNSSER